MWQGRELWVTESPLFRIFHVLETKPVRWLILHDDYGMAKDLLRGGLRLIPEDVLPKVSGLISSMVALNRAKVAGRNLPLSWDSSHPPMPWTREGPQGFP